MVRMANNLCNDYISDTNMHICLHDDKILYSIVTFQSICFWLSVTILIRLFILIFLILVTFFLQVHWRIGEPFYSQDFAMRHLVLFI